MEKTVSRIIRVMTLNIWNSQGPYDKRMPLIIEGLQEIQPDIIGLQEVLDKSDTNPNQAELIAKELEYQYVYQGATRHTPGLEGVAIVSKYPILESDSIVLPHATEELTRVLLRARIETPVTKLDFYTTHLNWKLDEGYIREEQVLAIQHYVKKYNDGLPVIMSGDFNAKPESAEIRFLTGNQSLKGESAYYQDAWYMTHRHEDGYSWSYKNAYTRPWLEPDRRIDYIFVSQPTRESKGIILDCHLVLNRPDLSGVFPSDHFGMLAEIKY